jgi:hypothetical protein
MPWQKPTARTYASHTYLKPSSGIGSPLSLPYYLTQSRYTQWSQGSHPA